MANNFTQLDIYKSTHLYTLPQDIIILIMQYSFFKHNSKTIIEACFRMIYFHFSIIDYFYEYKVRNTEVQQRTIQRQN